jgi:predicted GIY-YIG superfamily endonuclease
MVYIYILQLEDGKYYIGKTINPKIRLEQHFYDYGSSWTKKYNPKKVLDIIPDCDNFDEDKYTIKYMKKYGIDNVRGGSFCELVLSKETLETINKMIIGSTNKCYNCGETGHYANNCYSKTNKNKKLDKYSDDSDFSDDYFSSDYDDFRCNYCSKNFDTLKGVICHQNLYCKNKKNNKKEIYCYRCGRDSHISTECYASTHINGKKL